MSFSNERNPHLVVVPVGTQAAGITLPVATFRKHSRLKQAILTDQAGVAASNVNYVTASLQDLTGTVYATYDSRAAGQGALVANSPGVMALPNPDVVGEDPAAENPASNQETDIPAGTTLVLVLAVGGAGALTKALLQLEEYPA